MLSQQENGELILKPGDSVSRKDGRECTVTRIAISGFEYTENRWKRFCTWSAMPLEFPTAARLIMSKNEVSTRLETIGR